MTDLKDLSIRELFQEMLTRVGKDTCIEIQLGRIMQIAYYPTHIGGARFKVTAESHMPLETTELDEAINAFMKLYGEDQ